MVVREQTKEQIVLLYFLQNGNEWASADAMVRWSQYFKIMKGETTNDISISRAGAVKICKRLVPELLESLSTTGYRSKKVILYRLAENVNGYTYIAHRLNYGPLQFLTSSYARDGVEKFVIPKVEGDLSVKFGHMQQHVFWALSKSPTAMMMALDGGLAHGDIAKLKKPKDRIDGFIEKLACAINVDMASQNRGTLLSISLNEGDKEQDSKMRDFFRSYDD